MKNIFTRNRKPAPQPETVNIADFLDVPTIETPTVTVKPVQPEDMQFCAACEAQGKHNVGAKHPLKSGYWYLGPIIFYVCDACFEKRIEKNCDQHFSQRKVPLNTMARVEAVKTAKQRATGA